VSDAARLLRAHILHRRALGEKEVFLPPGTRGNILARISSLASGAAGDDGRPPGPVQPGAPATPAPARARAGRRPRAEERPAAVPAPARLTGELARLAAAGTAAEIEALPDLATLRAVADACTRCALHEGRSQPVFADGSPDARVLCVGEAPGQREDETGLPFVGRAGQLLDRLLLSVGLRRHDVFICNVLKCRPPGNRNPLPVEIELCSPFLRRQVALVEPEVVVAFGTFAARTLLGTADPLGRLRGRTHRFEGRPTVVTYHPAALLRNPGWTRATWGDLQRVRALLEGAEGGPAGGETAGGAEQSELIPGVDDG
jgi:uracil-DNA glycosylase